MIYKIKFVKGLRDFVIEDLSINLNYDYKILQYADKFLIIESTVDDIDFFRSIKSALHIELIEGDKVLTQRNLFRREWRKHLVPAGVNPSIAFVLCKLANLKNTDILLDPFCGGGTIPITALIDFGVKKIIATDISSKAIEFTKKNLVEAKITKDKYSLFISDVKKLRFQKNSIDKIITNMPFGIREGDHKGNTSLYKRFFEFSYSSLRENGLLVVLTTEKSLVVNNIGEFNIVSEYKIAQGGLFPSIFVLEKAKS